MSDAKRCDNCGLHGYAPYGGWLHFEILGPDADLLGRGEPTRDFCSWACVEQRAKIEQLAVEQRERVGL